MKRIFDLSLSSILILLLLLPLSFISLIILLTSKGSPIHLSKRIGYQNKIFIMPKFRSMKIEVPNVATHLLVDVEK